MNLAVIFGGKSDEHEVSRTSAVNVLKALEGSNHDVMVVGITKEGRWYETRASYEEIANGDWEKRSDNRQTTIPADSIAHGFLLFDENDHAELHRIDCILPVLHGDHGEDGEIQGVFEMAEIPYCGPGVRASANCMDKSVTKMLAASTGVSMAKYCTLKKFEYMQNPEEQIEMARNVDDGKFPLFVKPSSAGSSVGAHKVKKAEDLKAAIEDAFLYDDKVLVEEMIVGREIEVAILGNEDPKASCVGEILSADEFYDYDAKYNNPESRTRVIDDLPEETLNEVRRYAVEIFKALDCRGVSRCDFFYSEDGRIVFNEINTLPGFTNISMYPQLWEAMGKSQSELVEEIIQLALKEHSNK
jgi:D-alanine-D-alanine ligase